MILEIPEPLLSLLKEIGEVGGKRAYLVGGFVRDLLLERRSFDIDIVVEGDAIPIARAISKRWNGSLHVHPQFGTATVTSAKLSYPKVDFVTARRETYQCSGTLPVVKQGTLADDLRRRDFSINALAMRLDRDGFGTLIDKTGGLVELKEGIVGVLHERSFLDDPTRIFRAFRYAGRYEFKIADEDRAAIRKALPVLVSISGERIRNEIDRILLEENAPKIVEQLVQFGIFEAISDGWKISRMFLKRFPVVQEAIAWASEHLRDEPFCEKRVRWMAFFGKGLPGYRIQAICFKLVLEHQLRQAVSSSRDVELSLLCEEIAQWDFAQHHSSLPRNVSVEKHRGQFMVVDSKNSLTYIYNEGNLYQVETPLAAYRELAIMLALLPELLNPGTVYHRLKSYPMEALVLAYLDTSLPITRREQIGNYLQNLRKIQPLITGKNLIEWGENPGKSFEKWLRKLLSAQLNGEITTKSEAYSLLQKIKKC